MNLVSGLSGSVCNRRLTSCHNQLDHEPANSPAYSLAELELRYRQDELGSYVERRKRGLTKHSMDWVDRASRDLWKHTHGIISKSTMDGFTHFVLAKCHSQDSHVKDLGFAKSFLKYLTKTRLDTRYYAFELFLERPRAMKQRKNVTSRIVTKADIEYIMRFIQQANNAEIISQYRAAHYGAFVLFGAYTGQRTIATISRLTVGQFREALRSTKPTLHVLSHQDKIRMEHYVPLHPQVVNAIKPLLDGRDNNELLFEYNSFSMWLKRRRIPLKRIKAYFNLSDLRKFCEQYGDVIQWDLSNRAYVLTHGVSGVEWAHYRHPLPEQVFDVYMRYWENVKLTGSAKSMHDK